MPELVFKTPVPRAGRRPEWKVNHYGNWKTKTLTGNAMTGLDVCRMMKRRLNAAGLPTHFSPHSFRATTVTELPQQNGALEDVEFLAGHSERRSTPFYGRRRRNVMRNVFECIAI